MSVLLAVALCGLYLRQAEPVYEAEARVLVQRRNLDRTLDGERKQEKEFLTTQAEVIRSPATVLPALQKVPPTAEELQTENEPVSTVLEDLRVSPLATTDILRVTYRHADRILAADRLAAFLSQYRSNLRMREREDSEGLIELLSEREAREKAKLDRLRESLATLRASSPLFGEQRRSLVEESKGIGTLTDRLTALRFQREQLEAVLAREHDAVGEQLELAPHLEHWSPETLRSLREIEDDLRTARSIEARAAEVYGLSHARRRSAVADVHRLEREWNRLHENARTRLEEQVKILRLEESQAETVLAVEQQRLRDSESHVLREADLERQIEEQQKLQAASLEELQEFRLTDKALREGRASVSVQVLDQILPPEDPVWPRPMPLLAAAGFLGALGGLFVVYLLISRVDELAKTPVDPVMEHKLGDDEPQQLTDLHRELQELRRDAAVTPSRKEPVQ